MSKHCLASTMNGHLPSLTVAGDRRDSGVMFLHEMKTYSILLNFFSLVLGLSVSGALSSSLSSGKGSVALCTGPAMGQGQCCCVLCPGCR